MSVEYTQIRYEVRDAVAVITLDRPERLNAWTPVMATEQAHAIDTANADPSVGAIVTTGAGRAFCAGADIEQTFNARLTGADPGATTSEGIGGMPPGLDWVALVRSSKPMIAAINGPAIGVGVTMCLPMDQIVTVADAKIALSFVKMGLVPEVGSSHLLAARVGFGVASDLLLSGRTITGTEAARVGLADHLCEPDSLLPTALELAATYAANPDRQLRMTKELLTMNMVESDLTTVQRREQALLNLCWESDEHAEAVAAFLEKRPASFRRTP